MKVTRMTRKSSSDSVILRPTDWIVGIGILTGVIK